MPAYVPGRGDLIWLEFSPQTGREQRGRRPAIVLSPKAYNRRVGLALCCPITSHAKDYPFEVSLPDQVGVEGVILSDQVRSLDWRRRRAALIGKVPSDTVHDVLARVLTLLDPEAGQ